MRILITGGRGFIGSATARAAEAAGHEVTSFDQVDGLDITRNRLVNDVFEDIDPDHVIHLAGVLGTAELFANPHHAVDVNVHGTLNVLEACDEYGAGYTGITMPPVFPSVYTATKVCADRLATAWHHAHLVPTSHVVAYNAFGPGQAHGPGHPRKIIPTFATEAWAGRPIPIWGDGEQRVDLIDADTLGQLLVAATAFGDDEVFDGGTGVSLSVNQVAEYVNEITSNRAGVEYLPMRPGEVPTQIVAGGAGWDKLGWRPEMDWDALRRAVEWYRPTGPAAPTAALRAEAA